MKTTRHSLAKERLRDDRGNFAQGITVGKVIRDAKIMKHLASYVIEIDSEGNVLQEYSNPPFETLLDCIVVLAPVTFQGTYVHQAVVLEIGLSRFVPYKATEIKANRPGNKKQVKVINERRQTGILSWKVTQKILPAIWTAIQKCIDEKMEKWTKARLIQEAVPGKYRLGTKRRLSVYESWMTIRIPKEYALIHAILRLKDESTKLEPGKNYAHVVETIRSEFDAFRMLNPLYRGKYPDEVLGKSKTLQIFAEWLSGKIERHGYTSRSIKAIRKLLKDGDSKDLSLFNHVCKVFTIPEALPDVFLDTYEPKLGSQKKQLISDCPLNPHRVYRYEKRRTTQARDCFTIAITGGREHMERLDIRNTNNRLLAAKLKEGEPVVEDQESEDSDIPF